MAKNKKSAKTKAKTKPKAKVSSKKDYILLNAQDKKQNPSAYVPNAVELAKIKKGDSLKLGIQTSVGNDFFWITVTVIDGNKMKGQVENKLVHAEHHGFDQQDEINFKQNNVFKIYKN